jgi:hypothetical protein
VEKADMTLHAGSAIAVNPLWALASRLLAGHAGGVIDVAGPPNAGTPTGAVTKKRGGWCEVSVLSHSGKEMSIVAEIARYTATDAHLQSVARKV